MHLQNYKLESLQYRDLVTIGKKPGSRIYCDHGAETETPFCAAGCVPVFTVDQPQIWNRFPNPLPGIGAATQQLTLQLPSSAVGTVLGLRITHIYTAYFSNLGLVVFTISQTIVLSYLFTRAYMVIEGINTSLWRFVPQEVLRFLGKTDIVDIQLGDQIHSTFAVLFADIRGFTQISEAMSPEASFRFLNAFLERTGPVIREHGGFIDKYIGDAIMAIFPDNTAESVHAAISLHREVNLFNQAYSDYPDIRIGGAINSDRQFTRSSNHSCSAA